MDLINADRWRYPRFFVDTPPENTVVISGGDAKHIISLRMKKGDLAVLSNSGFDYTARMVGVERRGSHNNVTFEILDKRLNDTRPGVNIRLFQCLPKADKLEFILQKATELGVHEFVPVLSERCVSRPDKKSFEKKSTRLQSIAYEATKQCGGAHLPIISPLIKYQDIFSSQSENSLKLIFYENGGDRLSDILPTDCKVKNIDIIIGSEGGFTESEIERAKANGYSTATLGKRILRCETAPIAAISILLSLTDN
ncbi:MAG: 16S rRNA (uracil(1498)-N(3))-methyltransferase [Oscillospiraceae bacterium]|nr:16S rRNA (uracil(1498)-N(3))-methyltransferase [Oscillospiraceae bacterium]